MDFVVLQFLSTSWAVHSRVISVGSVMVVELHLLKQAREAVVNCSDTHSSVMPGWFYSLTWVATSHYFCVASCCAVDPVSDDEDF